METMESKIREAIINEVSVAEISEQIGVSKKTIYKVIKKNRWKDLIKYKKNKIMALIEEGLSDAEISKKLRIDKTTVCRTRTIKPASKPKLTAWSENIFPEVQEASKKYQKNLSLKFVYIDYEVIESILLDLMIHTDQKNIQNKTAYFRKYAPFKISNLKTKVLSRETESLFCEDGEEMFGTDVNPEMLLMLREECSFLPPPT
jgi:IS30 family transposase